MDIIAVTKIEEVDEISKASLADGHYAMAPTHFWRDDEGKVAGFFSSGVIPVGHFWMRSDSRPRDSMRIIGKCEDVARKMYGKGIKYGMIACQKTSPFHDVIEKHFGYEPIVSDVTLFGVKLQ